MQARQEREVEMQTTDDSDYFMREPEVQRITGLSRTTRWRLQRDGMFPYRRQISPNSVGWLASEINAWVAEKSAPVEPKTS